MGSAMVSIGQVLPSFWVFDPPFALFLVPRLTPAIWDHLVWLRIWVHAKGDSQELSLDGEMLLVDVFLMDEF